MSKTNETGYAFNVTNFDKMVSSVNSFGATYNPSKTVLKTAALNGLSSAAKTAVANYQNAETAYRVAIGARRKAFAILNPLITRIKNSLATSDVSTEIVEQASLLIRKLRGIRATPRKTEAEKQEAAAKGEMIVENSSSRLSFESRIENMQKLLKMLTGATAYVPNEADLKVAALNLMVNDLVAKHNAVITAEIALNNLRILRNDALYKTNTGLVDVAQQVKGYVKSVYGATSAQFKLVSKLRFKNN